MWQNFDKIQNGCHNCYIKNENVCTNHEYWHVLYQMKGNCKQNASCKITINFKPSYGRILTKLKMGAT